MVTPVWALTIDRLCERKDDLLMSAEDIKKLAKNERAKAIDETVEKMKDWLQSEYGISENDICEIDEIAEKLKGGAK